MPAHYFVYMLVLVLGPGHGHERMVLQAHQVEQDCRDAAAESNKTKTSEAHFTCEPMIVFRRGK